MDDISDKILSALRQLSSNPDATFREGQREAIEILIGRKRLLLVQRTGWGKSAVYFVATKLLREQGLGPTLLISPLLALMRNQISAAERLGLRSFTINSSAESTVDELILALRSNAIDVVVISPERLANPEFAEKVMPVLGSRPGLTVIDEVHCISDWGHDFRPDYRRIGQMLRAFPSGLPILGCTATANDRVIEDVREQLDSEGGSDGIRVLRGPLSREGLALSVLDLPQQADRLAWLATNIATLPESGIVYCLTQRDTELVGNFLRIQGYPVATYHGDLDGDLRESIEAQLTKGSIKVIVATSALGMGYDNPRIGFVIHYQSPGSIVNYYQQVGRAGRALRESHGVLLCGEEDGDIIDWFINTSFPSEANIAEVLAIFNAADGPTSLARLEAHVNMKRMRLANCLKQLEVEGILRRVGGQTYEATFKPWVYPHARIAAINAIRVAEAEEMTRYARTTTCRMEFLVQSLNDSLHVPCGVCDNCHSESTFAAINASLLLRAQNYVDAQFGVIEPRKQDGARQKIPEDERLEEGRYLCRWADQGFGQLVLHGKQRDRHFDDSLVIALSKMLHTWSPLPAPTVVSFVPSATQPQLVTDFAQRVASLMGLPFINGIERIRLGQPQKTMQNSAHQEANVKGAFAIRTDAMEFLQNQVILLIDDVVDSRWTMTEIGRVLRRGGCAAVIPVALASSSS